MGLPLARLFSTKFPTVGFDMNQSRVDALMQGHDATLEVADELVLNIYPDATDLFSTIFEWTAIILHI